MLELFLTAIAADKQGAGFVGGQLGNQDQQLLAVWEHLLTEGKQVVDLDHHLHQSVPARFSDRVH